MPTPSARAILVVAATIPLLLFPSCGSGAAAAFGGGSGGSTTPTGGSNFMVASADLSPATITFSVSGTPSDVSVRYAIPGGASDEIELILLAEGIVPPIAFHFDALPEFSDTEFVVANVVFTAVTVPGGVVIGQTTVDVGNSPPVLSEPVLVSSPAESSALIPVQFTVSDISSHPLSLDVRYCVGGMCPMPLPACDGALGSLPIATSAGIAGDLTTNPTDTTYTFTWDSAAMNDLAGRQAIDVRLVFTVTEAGTTNLCARSISAPFTVDNNAAPIGSLTNGAFITNDDERRGIPIPFVVIDEEGDPTRTVFQWRREGEAFPALGMTVADFIDMTPEDKLAMQIASEMPLAFGGDLIPMDAPPGAGDCASTQVRLPELAGSQAGLLGRGTLAGARIDVLRTDMIPELVAWDGLTAPVGAVPRGDGARAVVLDGTSLNSWSLLDVALATGASAPLASGSGRPTALAIAPGETTAFVATADAARGMWNVWRVDLSTAPPTVGDPVSGNLIAADGIRGLLAPSDRAPLATLDRRVVRIDFNSMTFAVVLDFEGSELPELPEPSGIARDALRPDRVFVADRVNDRIFELDLNTTTIEDVSAVVAIGDQALLGPIALPNPQALAVEPASNTLIVLTRTDGGAFSLRAVPLRTAVDRDGDQDADAVVYELGRMPGLVTSIATGPDNLRLLAIPFVPATGAGKLAIGGGLQQSRFLVDDPVAAYDALTQVATVSEPFCPNLTSGLRWRIRDTLEPTLAAPAMPGGGGGTSGVFLWDSRDVPGGGRIHMKLIPMDVDASGDIGTISQGQAVKRVQAGLGPEPPPALLSLGGPPSDNRGGLVLGDLDGDGDLDGAAAIASEDRIVLFRQVAPRVPSPLLALETGSGPRDVAIGDLNGDGANDLISANNGDSTLQVFFGPTFAGLPTTLNGVSAPTAVLVVDLDGDQDADLVAAGAGPFGGAINGTVNVYLGDGAGLPAEPTQTLNIPGGDLVFDPCNPANPFPVGARPLAIAAGDLNGDGLVDLATANEAAGTASLFYQNASGDPPFSPGPTLEGQGTLNAFQDVLIADLDVDGNLDLAVANANPCDPNLIGEVLLFFNLGGSAGFAPPVSIGDSTMLTGAAALDAGDIDGDGDLDLVVANLFADTITPLLQVAPGRYELARGASLGGVGLTNGPRDVAVDDIDGDGSLDLVSINLEAGTAAFFFQTRPGAYTLPPEGVVQPGPVTAPASVAAGDLDGDGDVDLVSANEFSDDLSVFFQDNPGVIGPLSSLTLGGLQHTVAPLSVLVADLDGDGRMDVASANRGGNDLAVFCQDAAGAFPSTPIQLLEPLDERRPRAIAAADFDGDGLVDLVSANEGSNDLTLFRNGTAVPGNCQFPATPDQTIASLASEDFDTRVFTLRPGDFDLDGDLDLLVPHFGRSQVLVLENPGTTGALDPEPAFVLNSGPLTRGVDLGDLDGDGVPDIAVAAAGAPVFLQAANRYETEPNFTLGTVNGVLPLSIAIADLDADGDRDVGVTTATAPGVAQGSLQLFFQLNRSEFVLFDNGTLTDDAVLRTPMSLLVVDVDGDGDVDLVSANRDADLLSIFYGTH